MISAANFALRGARIAQGGYEAAEAYRRGQYIEAGAEGAVAAEGLSNWVQEGWSHWRNQDPKLDMSKKRDQKAGDKRKPATREH